MRPATTACWLRLASNYRWASLTSRRIKGLLVHNSNVLGRRHLRKYRDDH